MTYEQWMKKVDQIVRQRTGLSVDDFSDWLSHDAYDDDLTPAQAANQFLDEHRHSPFA